MTPKRNHNLIPEGHGPSPDVLVLCREDEQDLAQGQDFTPHQVENILMPGRPLTSHLGEHQQSRILGGNSLVEDQAPIQAPPFLHLGGEEGRGHAVETELEGQTLGEVSTEMDQGIDTEHFSMAGIWTEESILIVIRQSMMLFLQKIPLKNPCYLIKFLQLKIYSEQVSLERLMT